MSRKRARNESGVDPTDGAKLVWDLKPGDSFRDSMRMRGKIAKECELRYLKTGCRVRIQQLSEDEIEVSL